jgi:hypothetical protein
VCSTQLPSSLLLRLGLVGLDYLGVLYVNRGIKWKDCCFLEGCIGGVCENERNQEFQYHEV